jgi:Mg-dependent DNase
VGPASDAGGAHRPEHLTALRSQIEALRPIAVGEIGLDCFVRGLDFATQEYYYVEQLKIARDYGLPVLLHCRQSSDHLLKHLRRIRVVGGIAHAFNGSAQQAGEFIKLGFKLGFGGAFTWPRALHLRRLAAALPLDAIVLETDSPDIPPVWVGRARNAPGELPRIAQTLAELRGLNVAELAAATARNAVAVLALPAALYPSKPSARIAACVAGRAATRATYACKPGHGVRSNLTSGAQFSTVNR